MISDTEDLRRNIYGVISERSSTKDEINKCIFEIVHFIENKIGIDEIICSNLTIEEYDLSKVMSVIIFTNSGNILRVTIELDDHERLRIEGNIHHGINGTDFSYNINSSIEVGYCIYAIMFAIEEL